MTQNEEKVDSDQPDSRLVLLENEYIKLVMSHFRLRQALFNDFGWFQRQLKLAREATHSNRTTIISELLSYLDRSVPEIRKALKHLEDQIEERTVKRLKDATAGETASGLPRTEEDPADRFNYHAPQEDSRPKA
jgi:hypothetical protein